MYKLGNPESKEQERNDLGTLLSQCIFPGNRIETTAIIYSYPLLCPTPRQTTHSGYVGARLGSCSICIAPISTPRVAFSHVITARAHMTPLAAESSTRYWVRTNSIRGCNDTKNNSAARRTDKEQAVQRR